MRIFFLLLAFYCSCCSLAIGQQSYRFSSYSVDNGLPQNSIRDIAQDGDGFLWIATTQGLCRYDGYNFKPYLPKDGDSTTINSPQTRGLYKDSTGRLWVVTQNGISLYNSQTDKFKNIITYTPKDAITSDNFIFGEDATYIWAGLCKYGIVKVNKKTLIPTTLTENIENRTVIDDSHFWYSGFIEGNIIWVCFHENVYTYNIKQNKFSSVYCYSNSKKTQIYSDVLINLNDSEVIGANRKGIEVYNKYTYKLQQIPIAIDSNNPNISCIYKLSNNEVILGSSRLGLIYFNIHTQQITQQITNENTNENKKSLYISCLYKDLSGNLWIGTLSDGLKKSAFPHKNFKYFHSFTSANNSVLTLFADSLNLYAGYFGNGLDIYSKKNGFIKNIPISKKFKTMLNGVYNISPYQKDELLLFTKSGIANKNNLLVAYSLSKNNLYLPEKNIEKKLLNSWYSENLRHTWCINKDGNVLTNICNSLVCLKTDAAGTIIPQLVHCFENEYIITTFYDAKGDLWVGTFTGVYKCHHNTWQKIIFPNPNPIEIKTITQDKLGNIWLGSPNGILVIDSNYKLINQYNEATGLPNQHLYGLLTDNNGNIWFSHNKGLSVYYWKEKLFKHFTVEDGLQSNEFNAGAYYKASDGELYFGGVNGINSFYPDEITTNPNKPIVKITGISLFDVPYKTDTPYWNIRTIKLPFNKNCLSFEFCALEFTNPNKNRYAYKMEGIDKHWLKTSNLRFARYPGLPPGKYIFKVKASNNDGVWNEIPTTITIYIKAPYWQQGWFIVLAIFFSIALIATIVYQIDKQRNLIKLRALEIQQKIQEERERISRDLHDNVGTQLSYINSNLEWTQMPNLNITEQEKKDKLNAAITTSKEAIATLRETIWAIRKEEISIEEFSDKLKSFAIKQAGPYPKVALHFSEQLEGNKIILGPKETLNLFRICQEAISNTLKHANSTTLDINIQVEGLKYSIKITDNGKGFIAKQVDQTMHYGIENMKYRANEIGCTFVIVSDNSIGTQITISKK